MSDTVPIEAPHLPGNYSARTSTKWDSSGRSDSNTANLEGAHETDEIHKRVSPFKISPGQLYSTDSGRLFHAGKLLICLAGLPGRGKTHLSVSLTRYLRWLGVTTQLFHFDDYRREFYKEKQVEPHFFSQKPENGEIGKLKSNLIDKCLSEIEEFFIKEQAQIIIYDAINGIAEQRLKLQERFSKINVKIIFIESLIDDDEVLSNSLKEAIRSPDYKDWEEKDARIDFNKRINEASHNYEKINDVTEFKENELLTYIKTINFGQRFILNKTSNLGYLMNRILFFLLNTRIKKGSIFFARCGDTNNGKHSFKTDPELSEKGKIHSEKLGKALVEYLLDRDKNLTETELNKKLVIWTSTRRRTVQTAQYFLNNYDIPITQRSELTQLNPGNIEHLSQEEIREKFPIEYNSFKKDPYHVRFPRSESYHDVAVRLEPLILEMERNTTNMLIIGHESVLRVLYGYLMNCSIAKIPYLEFPADEIVEVSYNAYANVSKRIQI